MSSRTLTWLLVGLAVVVWAVPLHLGWYVDRPITDIPTYEAAWRHIADGQVPYRDFPLEYPPLAARPLLARGRAARPLRRGVLGAHVRLPDRDAAGGPGHGPRRWAWTSGARPSPASPSP